MSNQRSVMTEFRSLEQKRLTVGLTGEEELRLEELRELVGPEVAPPPRAGFDVGAAASRLRESLLPAGLRSRPLEMGPPPAAPPGPPEPFLFEADAEPFEPAPEPGSSSPPEPPWAGEPVLELAPEAPPEPELAAASPLEPAADAPPEWAPEQVAWQDAPADGPAGEVRPQAWNPEAPGYDPDAPYDEAAWIAAGYDPNVTYDWSAAGYDSVEPPAGDLGELPPPEAPAEAQGWSEQEPPLVAEAGWPGSPEPLVEGLAAESDPLGRAVPLEVEEAPWIEEEAPEAEAPAFEPQALEGSPAEPPGGASSSAAWSDAPYAAQPVRPEVAAPAASADAPPPVEDSLPFDPDAPFDHAKWFGRRAALEAESAAPVEPAHSPAAEPHLEPEAAQATPPEVEEAPAAEPAAVEQAWAAEPLEVEEPPGAEPSAEAPLQDLEPVPEAQEHAPLEPAPEPVLERPAEPMELPVDLPVDLEPTLELDLTVAALAPEPAWNSPAQAEPPAVAASFGEYDEAGGASPRAFAPLPAEPAPAPSPPPAADPASAWFDEVAAVTGHLPAPPSAAFGEYDESAPPARMVLDLGSPAFTPAAAPPPALEEALVEEGFEPGGPALDPAALAPLASEPADDFDQGHLYGGPEDGVLPGGAPLELGDPSTEWLPEAALDAGFELASDGSFGHPDPGEAGTPAWSGPVAGTPPPADGWESTPALDLSAPFEAAPLAPEEELPTLAADDLVELAPEPAAAELPPLELDLPGEPAPSWSEPEPRPESEPLAHEEAHEPAAAPLPLELQTADPPPAWASEPEPVAPELEATPAAWEAEAFVPPSLAEDASAEPIAGPAVGAFAEPFIEQAPEPAPAFEAAPTEAEAPAEPEPAVEPLAAPAAEPAPRAHSPWEPEPAVSYEPPPPGLALPPEIAAAYPEAPAAAAFELPPALTGDLFDDLPEPEATPEPVAPAPQVRVEGSCRVVLHTVDGQVRRGLLRDTFLDDASLTLLPQGPGEPEVLPADGIKAIFFMLAPGEKAPPPDGRKVRVTFRDGRQVAGYSPDYREGSVGFFMIPADTRTNTGRIWVYQAAVRQVTVS